MTTEAPQITITEEHIATLAGVDKIKAILARRKQESQLEEWNKRNAGITMQHKMANIPLTTASAQAEPATTTTTATPGAIPWNWNEQQQLAIRLAAQRRPFCLIGAAGTGKTTVTKECVQILLSQIQNPQPLSIALVSFTNRAVRNIIRAVKDIGADKYCQTIHKFLGYHPEFFDYTDENGEVRTTMRFIPKFNAVNPIYECQLVIIDESSMVSTDLYQQLVDACPNAIFIYIGDLNQLKPVFGHAILGYKLNELPVVELAQVYRQAMESPIIWFQHTYTLKGKLPSDTELDKINEDWKGKGLEFKAFKASGEPEQMAEAVAHYIIAKLNAGEYDPAQDTILIPKNDGFGCNTINLHLAEYFAKKEKREVFEVIAGFNKHYFAVDDFVMYAKKECTIVGIEHNRQYFGQIPQPSSIHLSRYGYLRMGAPANQVLNLDVPEGHDFLAMLSATDGSNENEEGTVRKQAASHVIVMRDNETGETYRASSAGDINGIVFGWSMTVHKSQGSEWRKVWLVLCKEHTNMLSREILYTGMTRARKELCVIYTRQTQPGKRNNSIARCIKNQSIPGNTWREKAEYFKGAAARVSGG